MMKMSLEGVACCVSIFTRKKGYKHMYITSFQFLVVPQT